jgi:hypothetical protein
MQKVRHDGLPLQLRGQQKRQQQAGAQLGAKHSRTTALRPLSSRRYVCIYLHLSTWHLSSQGTP